MNTILEILMFSNWLVVFYLMYRDMTSEQIDLFQDVSKNENS